MRRWRRQGQILDRRIGARYTDSVWQGNGYPSPNNECFPLTRPTMSGRFISPRPSHAFRGITAAASLKGCWEKD